MEAIERQHIETLNPVLNGTKVSVPTIPEQYRVTVTLSRKTFEEMEMVASEKGIPLAKHLGMIVESHHETPAYGNLVKHAKTWEREDTYEK